MLNTWLNDRTIQFCDSTPSWQEAIALCAAPLLADGTITTEYLAAIYQQHQLHGPYFVIGVGIALPHSRPEHGVNRLGMSLLMIKHGVNFGSAEHDPIYAVFLLAAIDTHSHLGMMTQLAELLSNKKGRNQLLQASNKSQILALINHNFSTRKIL